MKEKIEYSVVLADNKNPAIKHVGKSDTLSGAKKIKEKRKIIKAVAIWKNKFMIY